MYKLCNIAKLITGTFWESLFGEPECYENCKRDFPEAGVEKATEGYRSVDVPCMETEGNRLSRRDSSLSDCLYTTPESWNIAEKQATLNAYPYVDYISHYIMREYFIYFKFYVP